MQIPKLNPLVTVGTVLLVVVLHAYHIPTKPRDTIILFILLAALILLGIFFYFGSNNITLDLRKDVGKSIQQFIGVSLLVALLLGINLWFGTDNFYELFSKYF